MAKEIYNKGVQKSSVHVVMLTGQFVPEVFGGAEQQCARLSRGLAERGVRVTVLSSRSSMRFASHENDRGVEIVRFFTIWPPQVMGIFILASAIWVARVWRWFSRRSRSVDIIHVHQYKFQAYVASIIGRLYNIPVIVKPGNAGEHSDFASLQGKAVVGPHLHRMASTVPAKFVAISEAIANEILAAGVSEKRIERIPNGVAQPVAYADLVRVRTETRQRIAPDLPREVRTLAFAGRLEPVKNVGCLLEALVALKRGHKLPPLQVWIIGAGSEETKLRSQAASSGLSDDVKFLGYQPDITSWLLAADFLALTSLAEGMSNALLEAMAAGTIPVCTPVSGSTDLIANGSRGFLADGFTVPDISLALSRALELSKEDVEAMALRCFEYISDTCEIGRIADRYVDLYADISAS